jgi:hypothetical protein
MGAGLNLTIGSCGYVKRKSSPLDRTAAETLFYDRLSALLFVATLLGLALSGCSNEQAFVAADYAKCRELGFIPGDKTYDLCLSEVQRRRITMATSSEESNNH